MNPAQLLKMANQIGAFFEAMPDREQATRDVASHIARSWEPRMIRALRDHIAAAGDKDLSDIGRDAISRHLHCPPQKRRDLTMSKKIILNAGEATVYVAGKDVTAAMPELVIGAVDVPVGTAFASMMA